MEKDDPADVEHLKALDVSVGLVIWTTLPAEKKPAPKGVLLRKFDASLLPPFTWGQPDDASKPTPVENDEYAWDCFWPAHVVRVECSTLVFRENINSNKNCLPFSVHTLGSIE